MQRRPESLEAEPGLAEFRQLAELERRLHRVFPVEGGRNRFERETPEGGAEGAAVLEHRGVATRCGLISGKGNTRGCRGIYLVAEVREWESEHVRPEPGEGYGTGHCRLFDIVGAAADTEVGAAESRDTAVEQIVLAAHEQAAATVQISTERTLGRAAGPGRSAEIIPGEPDHAGISVHSGAHLDAALVPDVVVGTQRVQRLGVKRLHVGGVVVVVHQQHLAPGDQGRHFAIGHRLRHRGGPIKVGGQCLEWKRQKYRAVGGRVLEQRSVARRLAARRVRLIAKERNADVRVRGGLQVVAEIAVKSRRQAEINHPEARERSDGAHEDVAHVVGVGPDSEIGARERSRRTRRGRQVILAAHEEAIASIEPVRQFSL